MTPRDELDRLRKLGVEFKLFKGQIRCRVPEGVMTDDVRDLIALYDSPFRLLLEDERDLRQGCGKKPKRGNAWPDKIVGLGPRDTESRKTLCYTCDATTQTSYGLRPVCRACANKPDVATCCRFVPYLLSLWDNPDANRLAHIRQGYFAALDDVGPARAKVLRDLWAARRGVGPARLAAHNDQDEAVA